jgi:hypothetical protein
VTTIRVTRRPATRPTGTDRVEPGRLRLALIEPESPRTTLDGAWWPRTRNLSDELPALVTELHSRGIRATRVAYNPAGWDPAPRRLDADGRVIRLGWFRGLDPQMLDLTGDLQRARVDLLVVPPDTSEAAAAAAFAAASEPGNSRSPAEILTGVSTAG